MKSTKMALVALAGAVMLVGACATRRPVFYPNEHLRQVGSASAQRDVDECLALARSSGYEAHPGREVAGQTAGGAAEGAVVGTAVGAVTGNIGQGAGVGATAGATHGLLQGIRSSRNPDPLQRRFVEECLTDRGYRILGWR